MGKKRKLPKGYRSSNIGNALSEMKYRDLQCACIIRGMDFQEMVEGDFPRLSSWLHKNWANPRKSARLDEFDEWRKQIRIKAGKGDEPMIRLGFIDQVDEEGVVVKTKRPRKIKKDKAPKKERDSLGLFAGTKKSLTFQCCKDGKNIDETYEMVLSKFPDAVEKSVRIWWKKAKRSLKE